MTGFLLQFQNGYEPIQFTHKKSVLYI